MSLFDKVLRIGEGKIVRQLEATYGPYPLEAGGGLVTAVVSGTGELKSVSIDPKAVDPEDTETLSDLVVAAVRDANRAAQELQAEKMGPLAGGLDMGGGPQLGM